ncbi:MAG: chromate transporter [Lachnospiraceae bacterium]|nr:chromate transporter [Lachnospiraceae bacterium]
MWEIYLRLIWEYFKTGLFAIGGGMATLPFLNEIGEKTGWFTKAQLADMIAVSESTPGPIGINMSTYIGFEVGGVPGSFLATVAIITPSILVILIISRFLDKFKDNFYVQSAFYGLRPASTGLIAAAGIGVVKIAMLNPDAWEVSGSLADLVSAPSLFLAAALLIATNFGKLKKLHPVVFIAASAGIGILFRFAGA